MPSLHPKAQALLRRATWLAHQSGSKEVGVDHAVEAAFLFLADSEVLDDKMGVVPLSAKLQSALAHAAELAKADSALQIYEHHLWKATAPASR